MDDEDGMDDDAGMDDEAGMNDRMEWMTKYREGRHRQAGVYNVSVFSLSLVSSINQFKTTHYCSILHTAAQ